MISQTIKENLWVLIKAEMTKTLAEKKAFHHNLIHYAAEGSNIINDQDDYVETATRMKAMKEDVSK